MQENLNIITAAEEINAEIANKAEEKIIEKRNTEKGPESKNRETKSKVELEKDPLELAVQRRIAEGYDHKNYRFKFIVLDGYFADIKDTISWKQIQKEKNYKERKKFFDRIEEILKKMNYEEKS